MTSPQDLPPPEKTASQAEEKGSASVDANPQVEKPPAKKGNKFLLLLILFAVLVAPIVGVGAWLLFGQPKPIAVEPGTPIPPEPPAPPPPFKATLAAEEVPSVEAGGEDVLAKTTDKISTL
ncbi:MAG: hypothetical protein K8R36_05395, partial [Planctomycetales bacterium]|nr:hypothetical protein [Planctomycetales bacterium]